jgi:hypothetical protein
MMAGTVSGNALASISRLHSVLEEFYMKYRIGIKLVIVVVVEKVAVPSAAT